MRAFIAFSFLLAAGACGAPQDRPERDAESATAALSVDAAWAAPSPAGVDVAAGYLTIRNGAESDDRLLSATSPRADRVEIHEMLMEGPVMRMRPVQAITVPAGGEAVLAPGGTHLMFMGIGQSFAEGEQIPVELTFETAGAITIELPVRRPVQEHNPSH